MKSIREKKKTAKAPTERDWREVELNHRPPVLAANRTAVYTGPLGVTVRFLHTFGVERDRLTAGAMDLMQLTNVATLEMHPAVAKRLIVDLQNGLAAYETAFGEVPELEAINAAWDARAKAVN